MTPDLETTTTTDDAVVLIALADIAAHPSNPPGRISPADPHNQELATNIRETAERRGHNRGVLQAITVAPTPEVLRERVSLPYVIVFGHRRWAASSMAGQDAIRAVVDAVSTPEEIAAAQIVENAQREDLPPLQEARQIQTFMADYSLSLRATARYLGKAPSWASKRLALLKLPPDVQVKVDAGLVSKASGYELARLAEHPELLRQVVDETQGLDEVGVRDAVDRMSAELDPGGGARAAEPACRDGAGRSNALGGTDAHA